MKNFTAIVALLILASCNNNNSTSNKNNIVDSTVSSNLNSVDTLCFVHTKGNKNEDSFVVRFIIDGNNVTGSIKHLPWEKDAKVGPITGTKENDEISVQWTSMQEGMESSEPVVFKLDGDKALRQDVTYNDKGEPTLSNPSTFTDVYNKVDCSNFPQRNH